MVSEDVVKVFRGMLPQLIKDAGDDLEVLRLPRDSTPAGAVYLTILQSITECADMLSRPTITVGSVVRSTFESFADLTALLKEPTYVRRMLATFYEQEVSMLKDMQRNPSNPYHASLAEHLDPAAELLKSQALLDKQTAASFHPLSNFDRLDRAGLSNEYRSLYWQLCLEGHNSIAAVEARHIVNTPDGGFELVHFKGNRPGELLKFYDAAISMLTESTLMIHESINSPAVPRWKQHRAAQMQHRLQYLGAG